MNIEQIDKWLNEEYGCSYTRLDELLNFYVDRQMKFKERIDKAIEYINKTPLQKGTEVYRIDLLNILQGSDKDEN